MSSLFIISLVTALIALYLYLNLSEEIPRIFALAIVAICFVLDLIVAPWPVQLSILIGILVTTRTISLPNQN